MDGWDGWMDGWMRGWITQTHGLIAQLLKCTWIKLSGFEFESHSGQPSIATSKSLLIIKPWME